MNHRTLEKISIEELFKNTLATCDADGPFSSINDKISDDIDSLKSSTL